jgi:hypothetical protein
VNYSAENAGPYSKPAASIYNGSAIVGSIRTPFPKTPFCRNPPFVARRTKRLFLLIVEAFFAARAGL